MKMLFKFILIIFTFNILIAGCGGCSQNSSCSGDTSRLENKAEASSNINALINFVPEDGNVDGLVITSCGTCNLDVKRGGCSLSVKIGSKVYSVKGSSIRDHGDMHSSEGLCSVVRVARAKGSIKKNVFYADSFSLIGSSD